MEDPAHFILVECFVQLWRWWEFGSKEQSNHSKHPKHIFDFPFQRYSRRSWVQPDRQRLQLHSHFCRPLERG